MNQQEIKENLPKLPYWIENRRDLDLKYIKCDNGSTVCTVDTECYSMDAAISAATISAINNTYGKGINPESVPDIFAALQVAISELDRHGNEQAASLIQDILNKAAL